MKKSKLKPSVFNGSSRKFWKKLYKARWLFLLFLPVFVYYIMFRYVPMLNTVIAFKDYNIFKGVWGSEWNHFAHFKNFLSSPDFWRILRNTLGISIMDIVFTFTSSIVLALLLNAMRLKGVRNTVQILSYLPHFISLVVIAGIFLDYFSVENGWVAKLVELVTGKPANLLYNDKWFWPIYTLINVWKSMGWGSIIYVAAISRIDPCLYEAAAIDGANGWQQTRHITLPGIKLTIVTMLIIKIGQMLNVGYEMIILLNNSQNWSYSDVISVYVYRMSLGSTTAFAPDFGFAAAVGLLQAVIGFVMVVVANKVSKKVTEESLW